MKSESNQQNNTSDLIGSEAFNGIEEDLNAEGLFALARWFDDSQQNDPALKYYQKALDADPGMAEAHYNMATIYSGLQDNTRAVFHLEKAINLKPDIPESYSLLGMIRFGETRIEEGLALLEQAVSINPQFSEAHFNMGLVLQEMGEHERSINSFEKALASKPTFAQAHWRYLFALPILYDTPEQIDRLRSRFSQNLDQLIDSIKLETPQQIQYALQGISTATNFYLQYQCYNDIELQKKYGGLVHKVMSAQYPQWSRKVSMPPKQPGEKIRVGYITSYMYRHTVGAFLAGWLENHNIDDFEIHCYHIGRKTDPWTERLKQSCSHFHHIPDHLESTAAKIVSDRLHVLVYNEIGMDIETFKLAALRLAPVQCLHWGHPVTSGLPTIDYFLSSDLMEPENADRHYTETLVRLPNLSLCYSPMERPDPTSSKKELDLPDNRFIFLSSQSIYKYLPQYDDIYPLIAKQVPHALFVFIKHPSQHATQRFHNRLRNAFRRHGLDADQFCHFSRRLNLDEFLSLNMVADLFLDSIEWSGGKTTLEAISCGLPIMTYPGRFMRGRHAYAMLTMMGIDGTIAKDLDDYCRIAVRMATDKDFYSRIKKDFVERRHLLYKDPIFMEKFEWFYRLLVQYASDPTSEKCRQSIAAAMEYSHSYRNHHSHTISTSSESKELNDQSVESLFRSAQEHMHRGEFNSALSCYRKVIDIRPNWEAPHYNMAVALRMTENIEEAIDYTQKAIEINPEYSLAYPLLFRLAQHACNWNLAEETSQCLDQITLNEIQMGRQTTEPPMTNIRRRSDVQANAKVAESWSRQVAKRIQKQSLPTFDYKPPRSNKIRIGYFSSDFKDHAVAYQVRGLLEQHDRNIFEIIGYACNPDDGTPYRRHLANACDYFHDIHDRTNLSIAEQINKDGINILIDMMGHSKGNRLEVTALRPAPVQISYLGFLSTTGAEFIDYVFADPVVVPKSEAQFFTEKIAYLPHCYQANDNRLPIAGQNHNRRQWNLPDDAFVFCSFNQPYKIDKVLFQTWMNILKQVNHGVLWLVERSPLARKNLCLAAEKSGVDPKRLIFTGFTSLDQNLARLKLADLALDTLIYNGGATTSNALWAGIPVLTTMGDHWVSRMSASALTALGMPELIAKNINEYEKIAIDLASAPDALVEKRKILNKRRLESPLFATTSFTRHVEKALLYMWQRYRKGLPPTSFQVK